jgi:hypothetical protein
MVRSSPYCDRQVRALLNAACNELEVSERKGRLTLQAIAVESSLHDRYIHKLKPVVAATSKLYSLVVGLVH